MKFAIFLLASTVAATPLTDETHGKLFITEKLFPESFVIYTGEYDIFDIVIPLNHINYDKDNAIDKSNNLTFFFVQADLKEGGAKDYKGLYVFKDNKARLVLENGQCSTYAKDTAIAYFGAKDGIYKYNDKDVTVTKYGSVTESVIKMAVDITQGFVYYLTEDYVLYKYNENEVESSKVDAIKDARDFVIYGDGHLFYYDGNKQLYTYDGNKVVKIKGLPANPGKIEFIRFVPTSAIQQLVIIDEHLYEIFFDGRSKIQDVEFQVFPTAYAPDTPMYQYYAYKKKIYKYNLKTLLEENSIEELSTFFKANEDQINAIKTSKLSNQL